LLLIVLPLNSHNALAVQTSLGIAAFPARCLVGADPVARAELRRASPTRMRRRRVTEPTRLLATSFAVSFCVVRTFAFFPGCKPAAGPDFFSGSFPIPWSGPK
jgi:hypothetical protein